AVTVTDSVDAPTCSEVSTRIVWATATSTFSRVAFLKPLASTFSSYLPAGSDASVKLPVSVVVVSKIEPLSRFLADTLAPGTTAAAGSMTEPVMVPRSLWANAATVNNSVQNVFRTSLIRASSHTHIKRCRSRVWSRKLPFDRTRSEEHTSELQ